MKTAISVPDELFEKAETLAQSLKMSRSQLYSKALSEFVQRKDDSWITEQLNRVYGAEPSELDPVLAEMQARSIEPEQW